MSLAISSSGLLAPPIVAEPDAIIFSPWAQSYSKQARKSRWEPARLLDPDLAVGSLECLLARV